MRITIYLIIISLFYTASFSFSTYAENIKTLTIYHDSDYSNHNESAYAMKMGALTALAEINNNVQGYQINFIEKDNRGNSNRSLLHMQQFLKDSNALVFLGGLHSPPYIKNRDFINKNKLLLLVPWAAGGPITRYPDAKNWVFRLSVDDTKAGHRMAQFATQTLGCQKPQLLLENTPWGKSNNIAMSKALGNIKTKVNWFNWNIKANSAKIILREIISDQADCILFVGNALEGAEIINAMASFVENKRVPIISHWGITGGDFFTNVEHAIKSNLNLHFIQSCFSFLTKPQTKLTKNVVNQALSLSPPSIAPEKLDSPAGFIHAYDLTKILLQAISQTTLTDDIQKNRANIRLALENLNQPIDGLIKQYKQPFTLWSSDDPDAHEALGLDDLCMANYKPDGSIHILNNLEGTPE
ncbi:ABC transporter substrate-binding protein [Pseudoalteromonas fuliginea]|uniref:ABC transporter substrate-binding protein n=1 Tax=Pseudoalteromonas fuliginea TaxID=1872678 RepID=UPI00316D52DD